MAKKTCMRIAFGDPPCAAADPCVSCSPVGKLEGTKGPYVSYAGGRDGWHNGQTMGEQMREWKADWERDGLVGDKSPVPVGRGRWV